MPGVSLKRLIGRKSEMSSVLAALAGNLPGPLTIEDADGQVIFGEPDAQAAQRFPIQLGDQLLGWVSGDAAGAAAMAAVLSYEARQEEEKKSLAGELADRYRELSLLYRLAGRLAASPQPENVAEIALEEMRRLIKADAGAILLLDGDELRAVTSFGLTTPLIRPVGLLQQVLQTGKAELANHILGEDCIGVDQGERVSIMGAPLKTDRCSLGIVFLMGSHDQVFTAGELKLLNAIAMQVAPALEISRLYEESIEKARFEHELKMARQVQESLLPRRLPELSGWAVACRWRPAREVSGDFYDVIQGNDRSLELVIADVTGKGMPASLYMAFTRSLLRVSIYNGSSPASIINSVNHAIYRDSYEGLFTTLVYARLDPLTGLLTYVNAGHNPPLLYRAASGEIEALSRTGLPLGVHPNSRYEQQSAQLEMGDFLLFYTDGITEATNPEKVEFGIERLKQQVIRDQHCEVEVILDGIEAALRDFTSQGQSLDDVTMMGLKRTAAQGGTGW